MNDLGLTISHITISVADLDVSIQWYRDKLGFELIRRFRKDSIDAEFAFMDLLGFSLEMICKKGTSPIPNEQQEPTLSLQLQGIKYFAFRVENVETISAELKRRNVRFVSDVLMGSSNHRYAIFVDINGIMIELFENHEFTG